MTWQFSLAFKTLKKVVRFSIELDSISKSTSSDEIKHLAIKLEDVDGLLDVIDDENARSNGKESDHGFDNYQSGDDTSDESDSYNDEVVTCVRYDTNLSGFEFTPDGDNIALRPGQLYVDVYEFRKVFRVYAIKNGFKLYRLKNEKTIVIAKCAKLGCTWRIHASPNWNNKSF